MGSYSLDTTLGTLLDQPQIKGLLEQHFPGVTTNPFLGLFRGVTLRTIIDNPEAAHLGITDEKAAAFLAEINQFVP
jgi:hypothetical protein